MPQVTNVHIEPGGDKLVVASGGEIEVQSGATIDVRSGATLTRPFWNHAKSRIFNLDNGAGVTIDDVLIKGVLENIRLINAQIIYTTETTGTVAAGNIRLGTTLGGSEIAAATAYENTKAVGTTTLLTLLSTTLGGLPLFVRHTGVAATAAGEAYLEIIYTVDGI